MRKVKCLAKCHTMILYPSRCLGQHGRQPQYCFLILPDQVHLKILVSSTFRLHPELGLILHHLHLSPIISCRALHAVSLTTSLVLSKDFETSVNLCHFSSPNLLLVFHHRQEAKVQAVVSMAICVWILFSL